MFLKLLMATSGAIFVLFVLGHMYGNLMAFGGEETFNNYAEHLRTIATPMLPYSGLLWILRVILVVSLVVHVASALRLWARAASARSTRYVMKKNLGSSLSSRTMRFGGLAILLFIVWHLLNFTIVKINIQGGETNNPFQLMHDTFSVWWMTIIYLAAMVALAFHLHHGVWSASQTLGWTTSTPARRNAKALGWILALVVGIGFSLVPLGVLVGII